MSDSEDSNFSDRKEALSDDGSSVWLTNLLSRCRSVIFGFLRKTTQME